MGLTSIEWTTTIGPDGTRHQGYTFNPWWGCWKISPGCEHCYAWMLDRRTGGDNWEKASPRRFFGDAYWAKPLAWDERARKLGVRLKVFCASMADVFEDRPELITTRCRLFSLIHRTTNLDWLLLTKRPEGIRDRLHECATQEDQDHGDDGRLGINDGACLANQWMHGSPMPNAWLGVSVEDQRRADERIPVLLSIPAAVRFLSCEPLLGPVDLHRIPGTDILEFDCDCPEPKGWEFVGDRYPERAGGPEDPDDPGWATCCRTCGTEGTRPLIDWVIVGGESGPDARPLHPDWARSLRDQCQSAGVACFFKQWGEWLPFSDPDELAFHSDKTHVCLVKPDGRVIRPYAHVDGPGQQMARVGKKAAGRTLDGRTWDEFPQPQEVSS